MTGHILPGGRDGENSPRRDVWVGGGGGSKQEEAGGCPFAIPRAVAITAVLVTVAASTLLRRSLVRFRLLLSTAAATVVAVLLFGTSASAVAVQPAAGKGFIEMTQRVCGTSAGWQANANRNGVYGEPWRVYLHRTYQIECAGAAPAPQPAVVAGVDLSQWTWTHPLPGRCVGSAYGMRLHPVSKVWKMHWGVDLGAPWGTQIRAAAAGTAQLGSDPDGAGLYVTVTHLGGSATTYFHMADRWVGNGQHVSMGQAIGTVGATGNATATHLHFEVHTPGLWRNRISPVPFMAARGVGLGC